MARVLYPHAAVEGAPAGGGRCAAIRTWPRRSSPVRCGGGSSDLRRGRRRRGARAAERGRRPRARTSVRDGSGRARLGAGALRDGTQLDLHCVSRAVRRGAVARDRERGARRRGRGAARGPGYSLDGDAVRDAAGSASPVPDEAALYALAGLAFVAPELARGAARSPPRRRRAADLVPRATCAACCNCHSDYSDGGDDRQMAEAARSARLVVLSVSATLAERVLRRRPDPRGGAPAARRDRRGERATRRGVAFRVLKGIEPISWRPARSTTARRWLDRFDYVIGSVHSRSA